MPKRFELLVFDWDGTLMDSAGTIAASLQEACRDLGLAVPAETDARHVIGLGLVDALRRVVPDLAERDQPALLERYRHHYLLREPATRLFPGAGDALSDLRERGFRLAIATGKSRRGLDRALAATGLKGLFDATRCADEGQAKPHPGMLYHLMTALEASPGVTLMIGDTTHDLEMARAANVAAVGVTYGAHPAPEILACNPIACIDTLSALHAWIAANA